MNGLCVLGWGLSFPCEVGFASVVRASCVFCGSRFGVCDAIVRSSCDQFDVPVVSW